MSAEKGLFPTQNFRQRLLTILLASSFLLSACKVSIPIIEQADVDEFLSSEDYEAPEEEKEKEKEKEKAEKTTPKRLELSLKIVTDDEAEEKQQQLEKAAAVTKEILAEKEELPRCHPSRNPQYAYRKRIALLPMELANPQDTVDLPGIERQYPNALLQRLDADKLITLNATQTQLTRAKASTQTDNAIMSAAQVKTLAKDLNAQFIISGKLLDLSFKQTDIRPLNLLSGIGGWKDMGQAIHQHSQGIYQRQFAAELNLFDGASGTLIESKQYRTHGEQNISVGAYDLNSNAFWSSQYGMKVSWLLDQQAKMVEDALACLPLRGRITRINHDSIELDVGTEALIIPGDKLQVFKHRKVGWTADGNWSYKLQHLGAMTVTRAYPLGATGKLDKTSQLQELNPGDIVQAW